MRWWRLLILIVVLMPLGAAQLLQGARADELSDDHVARIAGQLQCPVCPGETVANSEAQLAVQMRADIRQKIADGWSDRQILQFYVDRYGESILLNPPKSGFTMLIWLGVVAVVALGLVVVGSALAEVLRRGGDDGAPPLEGPGLVGDEQTRYAAQLERILRGGERG